MPIICPTITAYSKDEYKKQMDKIVHFCHRVQIDLTDGKFTPEKTVVAAEAWWPAGFKADLHLMYKEPLAAVMELVGHKPNLIIVHAEAKASFDEAAKICRHHKVDFGVALLPQTEADSIKKYLHDVAHVLIFSGNLGHQGGSSADLSLLEKSEELRKLKPELEIGWDGGVNDQNIAELVYGGIDVINVGGYIQSAEDPAKAFEALQRIADETGET